MTMKRTVRGKSRRPEPVLDRDKTEILKEARRFLERKRAMGYVVGGFLRDMLLGERAKDLDLVVSGVDPAGLALHLHKRLGLSRPVVFPRFRTALTVGREVEIEVCRLRGSIEEDARARDFTLNCLYSEIGSQAGSGRISAVRDPTGRGLEDLGKGLLRTPADPCMTLWLDPLRMLRAVRLGALRGFTLDRDLRESIPRLAYLLARTSPERVRTELEHILLSGRLVSSFRAMQNLGILEMVLPEVSRTYGFDQSTPYHAHDLFTHALKTAANTPATLALRLAGLLHDVGKPATRAVKGGRAVYYGHQEVSARLAAEALRRLRFPRRIREGVLFLVRNHMVQYSTAWSDKAVRRFVRKMGTRLEDMLVLAEADQRAQVIGARPDMPVTDLRYRIDALVEADEIHLEVPVDGRDIMGILGIEEGPQVGKAKDMLLEKVSGRDTRMSRQEAISLLKKWAKSQKLR